MIELKRLASGGYKCVDDLDISKLKGGKTMFVYHDVLGNIGKSKVCEVKLEDEETIYLADTTTGSLYDYETYACLSSDHLYLVPKP